jgi:hypothetical protein
MKNKDSQSPEPSSNEKNFSKKNKDRIEVFSAFIVTGIIGAIVAVVAVIIRHFIDLVWPD